MRADRLISTLLLLQTRGRVTAQEVAAETEVSVATARRDLEALSAAGVPVYSNAGRHGGWELVGGARTDLSGLTAGEAEALFLLAGPGAAASDEVKTALRKLVKALPATFRSEAQLAAAATVIDTTRWGAAKPVRTPFVELLRTAVVRRQRLLLHYRDPHGVRSERRVDPWGLVDKDGTWYLVAGTARGRRTFRTDRISDAEPTGETFERPDDFDLEAAWQEVVGAMEERRSRTWATVLIPNAFVHILRDHFGRHFAIEESDIGGRAQVRIGAPLPVDIARNLAGWGNLVEVIGPPEVRTELARIGAELVEATRDSLSADTGAGYGS
jgi:predicted DNA-binding transcriptional regulator YafY